MRHRNAEGQNLSQNGQNLVRIVIASYFLAVSLGFIPGTSALTLTEPFLPEPYADAASKAIIFATAYLVLIGLWLRFAALLLPPSCSGRAISTMPGPAISRVSGAIWR